MLMRSLSVFVILVSNSVYGQTLDRTQLKKDLRGLNPITVINNGQKGVWFSPEDADKILQILEIKLPLTLDIIDAQTKEVEAQNNAINLYKTSNDQYKELADYNRQMYDTAMKYFPSMKIPEIPWYETHRVVYVAGVLTGVAVMVGASYIVLHIPTK